MTKYLSAGIWFFLLLPCFLLAQTGNEPIINSTLEGKVVDGKTRLPLAGAVVHIKGTTHEVLADNNGKFNFRTGQKFPYTLIISYVGYETIEFNATEGNVEILLKEKPRELDEIVVVGYGTQKRTNLVGAVSKVDPTQTKSIPEGSFDAQLQGKAAGVQINTNTGVPGSDVFIRVRGTTSINAANDPLYVIDGVFISSATMQNISQDRSTSPLADINPSDIQSIEILKDASAVAIYGSRGANGAVIVTTKRGNYEQKPRIELNALAGVGWAPKDRVWKTTTGPEHAMLVNEYNKNMGKPVPFRPASELVNGVPGRGLPEEQPTYDRMTYLNRNAKLNNYDLSVQGGSKTTRYYLGTGYNKQESVWKPMSFERASFKVNLDQKINDKITIGTSNSLSRSYRNQARPTGGGLGTLLQASLNIPTYLPIFDADGLPLKWVNFDNIYVLTSETNLWSTSYHYIGNVYADVDVARNLKFRSSWSVDYNNYEENEYWDNRTILGAANGRATSSISQLSTVLNEQTLTFNKVLGKNKFGALIGNTLQANKVQSTSTTGTNFPNNSYRLISAAAVQTSSQELSSSRLVSFFSRIDYSYAGKYFIEATVRADGSSRFGTNNKWGYFPAVGAAWRISEEKFLKESGDISNLKFRVSYGITGNQNGINDFASQGLWSAGSGYADRVGSEQGPGTAPLQIANPNLKWERTAQFSTGIDLGLLKNRINLEFNYYNKYTSDVLLQVAVPGATGFSTYLTNFGAIRNEGFEVSLNSININNKDFVWRTEFNVAQNKNTIDKIPAPIPFAGRDLIRLEKGKPLYSYWLYKQLYVDPGTGDAVFEDINKDGQITGDDRQIVGNTWPELFGGFTNTVSSHGFDLGIFFTFSYGNDVWNHNRMLGETGGTVDANRVLLETQLTRWTTPGQITNTPKLTSANYARQENSRFLEDGSFIRLRSINLGYSLPKKLISKARIQNFRIYFTASNLLLFTKYKGSDPETNLSGSGSQNIQGYDYALPPQPRTLQLGLSATL